MMKIIMFIVSRLAMAALLFLPTVVSADAEQSPQGMAGEVATAKSDRFDGRAQGSIRLTPQEKAYIKNHPVIKVGNEMDYPPFDFAIEGQAQGYAIDLLNLLAKKIGIRFEFINGYTWDEIVQLFRERKLDLLPFLVKTPERSKFMLFSERVFRDRQMYITRKDHPDITNVAQLYGKTISQGKNWSTVELLRENYPRIPLLLVDNLEEMLSTVAYGKVDATIADEVAATYMIKQKGMSDLKVAGWARELDQLIGLNFHFAGQMDAPELISMLNKGLASLTVEELDGLRQKWFGNNGVNEILEKPVNLDENEKAFLASHPVIRVHNEQDWAPFNFHQNGQPQGYTIDMLNLLAKKLNVRIEYVSGPTWDEFMEMLRKREIDVIGNMVRTEERKKFARFTEHPMISQIPYIVSKPNAPYKSIQQLAGKTMAVVKGFWYENALREHYPEVKLQTYSDTLKCLEAVAFGDADATIGIGVVMQHIWLEKGIGNLALTGEVNLPGSEGYFDHVGVRKDWPLLVSALDKAMATVTYNEKKQLKLKWFGEVPGSSSDKKVAQKAKRKLPLSPAEKKYLESKKAITLCIDPDWEPYEMIDENGNHVGLTADYFDLFREMIPVPIKLLKTETWDESMQFAKDRKCDLLSMLSKSPERSQYLNFTEPYIKAKVVLVARNDVVYLDGLQSLSGKTLAIVKNYIYEEIVRTSWPKIKIIPVKNHAEGVQKVSDGSAYATIGSLMTILPQIQRQGLSNLKVAGPANFENEYRIGARNDEPELASIFDKAIKGIDRETKNQLLRRWYTVSIEEKFDYALLWKISVAVLLVMAIILYWNRHLSMMARRLNIAREEAEDANRAKDTFLANMSHELRTPLSTQLAKIQAMRDGVRPTDQEQLTSLYQSNKHLSGLVDDLYMLALADVNAQIYQKEPVAFDEIVASAVAASRDMLAEHLLTLEAAIAPSIIINGDARHLRQIIENLLGNAYRYATHGGTVRVTLERQDSMAVLTVSDSGPGVSDEALPFLFDRFYRVEGSRSREKGGSGLGLSLVKALVVAHDGQVEAFHSDEGGLGIRIQLPCINESNE